MVIVGITGGIGSGKSVAAEFFRNRGAAVIDADEIAHELASRDSPMAEEIAAAFGNNVVRADGGLDRRKLAQLVFGNAEALARLNALTHPRIMAEVEARLHALAREGQEQVVCLVAPLLVEAGAWRVVDRLLVLVADEEERVRRVVARDGLAEHEVRQRMAAQMPPAKQTREADWVVDTTAGREETHRQLEEVWRQLGL